MKYILKILLALALVGVCALESSKLQITSSTGTYNGTYLNEEGGRGGSNLEWTTKSSLETTTKSSPEETTKTSPERTTKSSLETTTKSSSEETTKTSPERTTKSSPEKTTKSGSGSSGGKTTDSSTDFATGSTTDRATSGTTARTTRITTNTSSWGNISALSPHLNPNTSLGNSTGSVSGGACPMVGCVPLLLLSAVMRVSAAFSMSSF